MKRAAIVFVWLLSFTLPALAATKHKNVLTWTPSSWTNVVYRVYRATVAGGPYTRIAGGVAKLQYNDTDVVSKKQLCYRVTAYQQSAKKESGYSPEWCGVTP